MQVRDVLFVEDLVDAMLLAQAKSRRELQAQAFNIGGGPRHTTSLLELIDLIGELRAVRTPAFGLTIGVSATSDITCPTPVHSRTATGWKPRVGVREGVARLHDGWSKNSEHRRRSAPKRCRVKYALVNPNWSFGGSIYFGCREPHFR